MAKPTTTNTTPAEEDAFGRGETPEVREARRQNAILRGQIPPDDPSDEGVEALSDRELHEQIDALRSRLTFHANNAGTPRERGVRVAESAAAAGMERFRSEVGPQTPAFIEALRGNGRALPLPSANAIAAYLLATDDNFRAAWIKALTERGPWAAQSEDADRAKRQALSDRIYAREHELEVRAARERLERADAEREAALEVLGDDDEADPKAA